jgi:hypothetical protein
MLPLDNLEHWADHTEEEKLVFRPELAGPSRDLNKLRMTVLRRPLHILDSRKLYLKIRVFWDVILCSLLGYSRHLKNVNTYLPNCTVLHLYIHWFEAHKSNRILSLLYNAHQSNGYTGQTGSYGSRRLRHPDFQSAHEGGKVVSPTYQLLFTPQKVFLVLISATDWVEPRVIVQPEGLSQWKIPVTPSGI